MLFVLLCGLDVISMKTSRFKDDFPMKCLNEEFYSRLQLKNIIGNTEQFNSNSNSYDDDDEHLNNNISVS